MLKDAKTIDFISFKLKQKYTNKIKFNFYSSEAPSIIPS